jgi:DNA-binding transcriptional LysR family regulator
VDRPIDELDLNLLRLAAALHETGSVTAAAVRLGVTQAAASNALARLRRACGGDPLFVR